MSIKRGHAMANGSEEKKVAPGGSWRNRDNQQGTTNSTTGGAAAAAARLRNQVHRYDLDDETYGSSGCLSSGRFMKRIFSSSSSSSAHVSRRATDPAMVTMSSTRRHLPHHLHLAHRHVWLLSLVVLIAISTFSCQPSSARTVFGPANGGIPQLMLKLDGADLDDYALELANRNLVESILYPQIAQMRDPKVAADFLDYMEGQRLKRLSPKHTPRFGRR